MVEQPRKYRPGQPLTRDEFDALVTGKIGPDVFIWFGSPEQGRPQHVGWTMNMSYGLVIRHIAWSRVRRAEITDEWQAWYAEQCRRLAEATHG